MEKITRSSLIVVLLVCCFLIPWAGNVSAAGDTYTLKYVSIYPPMHPSIVNGVMPWIEDMKKKSGGRLIIQFYAPRTLTPILEHYEAVKSGIADISFSPNSLNPGKFPLGDVIALPFMFQSAEAASLASWELSQQFPEFAAEYKDIKLLWMHTCALYELHTAKKPVRSLKDIQGMKAIVWTGSGRKYGETLGVIPQEILGPDTYMAMQRGMAEAVFSPLAPIRSYKLDEVTKYHTLGHFNVEVFWGGMNINSFEKLPPDLQKLIMDTSGDYMAGVFGRTLDAGHDAGIEWMKQKGHEFFALSDEETDKWREKVKPIYGEWVKDMEALGYKNAEKILETAQALGKKYQSQIDAR